MDALFNNQSAREKAGLQLAERPLIPIATKRRNTIHVPGARRSLTEDLGYESTEIPVAFNFMTKTDAKKKVREAVSWLRNKDRLAFDDDPDVYRLIQGYNYEPATNDLPQHAHFVIGILTEPHWYEDAGTETISGTGTIDNPGLAVQPVITLYGDGDITISINGRDTRVENVTEQITLDGIAEEATKNGQDANDQMIGRFPRLDEGPNHIEVTAGATADIELRWAYE